jgi:hypothetical protein
MQEPCTPDQRPAIRRQYQVFIRIRGRQHYLWRAVDQEGHVLDILVQSRRSAKSSRQAQCFLSTHSRIHNHFQLCRHRLAADDYWAVWGTTFHTWRDVAASASAA